MCRKLLVHEWHGGSRRAEAHQSLWLWRDLQCQDLAALRAGTRVVGCWITTRAAVTSWAHRGQQKDPSGLQQSLHWVLFCAEGSSGVGEAACSELPAAASSEEPRVQGAHAASVLRVQPACCLMDAEISSAGGSFPGCGQPTAVCGSRE